MATRRQRKVWPWNPMMAYFSHSSSQKSRGNLTVVLVHFAVAIPPVVELAGGDVEGLDEPPRAGLSFLPPAPEEIHDLVPRVLQNPGPRRVPQALSFFRATCSAIISARTSSLAWIFFSRYPIRFWSAEWFGRTFCSKAAASFSKNRFWER